jgi:PAS domain S-box-containing protein
MTSLAPNDEAEELLRPSADLLYRVIEYNAAGMHIFDRDGRFVLSNAAVEQMYGVPRSAFTGLRYDDPRFVRFTLSGEPLAAVDHPFSQVQRSGRPVYDVQYVVTPPQGARRVISVNAAPLFDDVGEFSGAVASITDITRYIEHQSHLQTLAVENARLYEETVAALRQRDALMHSITHDLKNPLLSILAHAQLLERRLARGGPCEPGQLSEGLAAIEQAARRLQGMVTELLDVARLEAGQPLELQRAPMDLVALVQGCIAELATAGGRHRFVVEAPLPGLVGVWDAARLERVLSNLLSNAVRYSPAGGEIAVQLEQQQQGSAAWAVVRVKDHGMGIPAAELPRIAERFYRASNVSTSIPGTGLGLASARLLVEAHGGTLTIASTEGEGTTVTVRLPLDPPPSGGS